MVIRTPLTNQGVCWAFMADRWERSVLLPTYNLHTILRELGPKVNG